MPGKDEHEKSPVRAEKMQDARDTQAHNKAYKYSKIQHHQSKNYTQPPRLCGQPGQTLVIR